MLPSRYCHRKFYSLFKVRHSGSSCVCFAFGSFSACGFFRFFRALKTAQEKLTSKRLAFLFLFLDQALDRLVSASSRIAALSPPTYCLIVFEGSYFFRMGIFFLRLASRLDAFSVYPIRISLPSYAVGTTTVAPGMRPLRSSRTRSSSSHDSYAHDG